MDIPSSIEKIIVKEGINYQELRQIIINAITEVDQEVWEIKIDMLTFPVKLNKNELYEFIQFFFLYEYDEAVYVSIYSSDNKITVECDKYFSRFMSIFVSILALGIITFIIMIVR